MHGAESAGGDRTAGGRAWTWGGIAVCGVLCAAGLGWAAFGAGATHQAFGHDPTGAFLLAVGVVVLVCQLLGQLFAALGQTAVVGQMLGGVLLGPSALGALAPSLWHRVFPADALAHLQMASNLGVVVFMFLLGGELRPERFAGSRARLGTVAAGATLLPFLVGLAVALPARGVLGVPHARTGEYVVYIGLVLAVTALPVLARMLDDLGLAASPLGIVALAGAGVGDAAVWGGLTAVLALTGSGGADRAWAVAGSAALLVVLALTVVRPLLARLAAAAERNPAAARLLEAVLVVGAVGFAAATAALGLHPASGAFLFGVVMPRRGASVARLDAQLRGFTLTILLPLFFAGVGLTTSVGLLGANPRSWLVLLALLTAAVSAKFAGAAGAARLSGLPAREAVQLGALMNCRGVTELLVIGIGWQYHIISALGVTDLVLIALVTTAATPWAVRRTMR